MIKVGIIGCGFVGGALKNWLENNNPECKLFISDPYKGYNDDLSDIDIAFLQIHVPTEDDGTQDLRLMTELIKNLPDVPVFVRTTILPGTSERLSKETGHKVYYMPEFLTERTFIEDFNKQIMVFTGEQELLTRIFVGKKFTVMSPLEAELTKYMHNVFGAYKVTYFNACREYCEKMGADWRKVHTGVLLSGDPASRCISVQRRQSVPCDAADEITVLSTDIALVVILPERSHVGFSHDAAGVVFLRGDNSCIFGIKDRRRYAEGIVQRSVVGPQDILVGIKIILHGDGPGNAAGLRISVNIRSISAGDDPGGGIHGIGGVVEDAAVVRDIVQPVSFIFHEVCQAGEPSVDLIHVRDDLKAVLPGTGVHAVDLAGNAVQSGVDIVSRRTHSFICLEIDIDAACHVGNGTAET